MLTIWLENAGVWFFGLGVAFASGIACGIIMCNRGWLRRAPGEPPIKLIQP